MAGTPLRIEPRTFRHKVRIVRGDEERDSHGEQVPTAWAEVRQAWAEVLPIGGREVGRARGFGEDVSHRITMRWFDGLLPTDRVEFRGRYFEINGIVNERELDQTLTLFCTEAVPGLPTAVAE